MTKTLYLEGIYGRYSEYPEDEGDQVFCFKSKHNFNLVKILREIFTEYFSKYAGKKFLAMEYGPWAEISFADAMDILLYSNVEKTYTDRPLSEELKVRGITVSFSNPYEEDGYVDAANYDLVFKNEDVFVTVNRYDQIHFCI